MNLNIGTVGNKARWETTKDNIRVISKRANVLKNNTSIEELELILNDLKNREVI